MSGKFALGVRVSAWAAVLVTLPLLLYSVLYPLNCSWPLDPSVSKANFVLVADPQIEGDARVRAQGLLGQIDLTLNDLYFRLISESLVRFLRPTHSAFLGDMVSSEFTDQREFDHRVARLRWSFGPLWAATRSFNVTGNHDIGYGDHATSYLVERFERSFGPVNSRAVVAGHLVVVVNSLTLDESDSEMRRAAWKFLESCGEQAKGAKLPVVLLTHVPMYKRMPESSGCDQFSIKRFQGVVTEQTHLSKESSDRLFRVLRPSIILTGHDHNGCFFNHSLESTVPEWTVRSVTGDYGGNAALLSLGKSADGKPVAAVSLCPMGFRMRDVLVLAITFCTSALSLFPGLCCSRGPQTRDSRVVPAAKASAIAAAKRGAGDDGREATAEAAPAKKQKGKKNATPKAPAAAPAAAHVAPKKKKKGGKVKKD